MITTQQALQKLEEGNARFVAGRLEHGSGADTGRRHRLAPTQYPFAAVLGCSDSRVPMEMVFDQGLGDLFVIRVAGNIATTTQIASVEFAVAQFGTPLVVVLGHSGCGAATAAVQATQEPTQAASPHLEALIAELLPCAQTACAEAGDVAQEALVDAVVVANVRATMVRLRDESPILQNALSADTLRLVGAVYDLHSGVVDFLDP
ncbi:MAG: carbonic anhydrase [Salinisphaera sp.]|nr:carbonic anhydrase [Salinisphaera sp.]